MKWFEKSLLLYSDGARGRNRTGTAVLGPTDFKSVVSTYFTTRASLVRRSKLGGGGVDFNQPIQGLHPLSH